MSLGGLSESCHRRWPDAERRFASTNEGGATSGRQTMESRTAPGAQRQLARPRGSKVRNSKQAGNSYTFEVGGVRRRREELSNMR
eukprot:6833771-Pyramimonas_sp.AAC.1